MTREGSVRTGILWAVGLALVVVVALLSTATTAQAQIPRENDDDQYGSPSESKGPVAEKMCRAAGNQNGVFDAGDSITYPGRFTVAPGASAVIDDTDDTVGTFIDGRNAEISSDDSGVTVAVTGAPINVSGGDGRLDDTVCESIVASTGISTGLGSTSGDAGGSSAEEGPLVSVLPSTGGSLLVALGALAVVGTGLALLRHRTAGR